MHQRPRGPKPRALLAELHPGIDRGGFCEAQAGKIPPEVTIDRRREAVPAASSARGHEKSRVKWPGITQRLSRHTAARIVETIQAKHADSESNRTDGRIWSPTRLPRPLRRKYHRKESNPHQRPSPGRVPSSEQRHIASSPGRTCTCSRHLNRVPHYYCATGECVVFRECRRKELHPHRAG